MTGRPATPRETPPTATPSYVPIASTTGPASPSIWYQRIGSTGTQSSPAVVPDPDNVLESDVSPESDEVAEPEAAPELDVVGPPLLELVAFADVPEEVPSSGACPVSAVVEPDVDESEPEDDEVTEPPSRPARGWVLLHAKVSKSEMAQLGFIATSQVRILYSRVAGRGLVEGSRARSARVPRQRRPSVEVLRREHLDRGAVEAARRQQWCVRTGAAIASRQPELTDLGAE